MPSSDPLVPLDPRQCPLMPAEVVQCYNRLIEQCRAIRQSFPRRGELVDSVLSALAESRVVERLTRQRFQVGFLGRNQIGKSTTFNHILGVPRDDAPSQEGNAVESTTSTITRLRAHADGSRRLTLRYATQAAYQAKRNALCESVGLDPALSDQQILDKLPEREKEIARGVGKLPLAEDPRYLHKLVRSYLNFPGLIGKPPEPASYEDRARILSHDARDESPSGHLLLADAIIDFPTVSISDKLELIDLPGLGSAKSLDTYLTEEFLRELDGVLLFMPAKAGGLDDATIDQVFSRLGLPQYLGDFRGRLWMVVTYFDGLSDKAVEGTHLGRSVFDAIADLARKRRVPLNQVCLVSNQIFKRSRDPGRVFTRDAVLDILGLPPGPDVPPQLARYPEMVSGFEELFKDGGIERLRALLSRDLVAHVGGRLEQWLRDQIRGQAERLSEAVSFWRDTSGVDLLPDVQACTDGVYKQLRKIETEPTFFDEAGKLLRGELLGHFRLYFPETEFYDQMELGTALGNFPGHAQALDEQLRMVLRTRALPDLYGRVGRALEPLPRVPVMERASPAQAWEWIQEQDVKRPELWLGADCPTFQVSNLFAGFQQTEGGTLNGKRYREILQDKVGVCTHQALHLVRWRLIHRLRTLQRHLVELTRVAQDGMQQAPVGVNYDEILQKLRSVCP